MLFNYYHILLSDIYIQQSKEAFEQDLLRKEQLLSKQEKYKVSKDKRKQQHRLVSIVPSIDSLNNNNSLTIIESEDVKNE